MKIQQLELNIIKLDATHTQESKMNLSNYINSQSGNGEDTFLPVLVGHHPEEFIDACHKRNIATNINFNELSSIVFFTFEPFDWVEFVTFQDEDTLELDVLTSTHLMGYRYAQQSDAIHSCIE